MEPLPKLLVPSDVVPVASKPEDYSDVLRAGDRYAAGQQTNKQATVPDLRPKEFSLADQFGVGALGTALGQYMIKASSADTKEDPDLWTPELRGELLARGYFDDERKRSIIDAAKNRTDLQYRISIVDEFDKRAEQMSNATGIQFAGGVVAQLAGGLSTSPYEILTAGGGAVIATSRIAGTAIGASRMNLAVRSTLGAAAAEIPASALRQNILQSKAFASVIAEDVIFGAVFDVPAIGWAVKRAVDLQTTKKALGEAQEALGDVTLSGAPPAVVQAHIEGVQALREKVAKQAREDGDALAAEVYTKIGPDATPAQIDAIIADLRAAQNHAAAAFGPRAEDWKRPDRVSDELETAKINEYARTFMAEKGIALSPDAAQIVYRARNTWDESVPESLVKFQARQKAWYDARKEHLKDFGGLTDWLDSSGLTFQLEKSQVARMLGSMLVETPSGYGKREYTAAQDFMRMKNAIEYKYVPALKEAVIAHQVGWLDKGKTMLGGKELSTRQFWYDVQLDRLNRREHIKRKLAGEYTSPYSETVQKAGKLLDAAMKDTAEQSKAHGYDAGEAILGGGFVGHMPYLIDAVELTRIYNEQPEVFKALHGLLHEQFKEKILTPGLKDLEANKEKYLADHIKALQDTVSTLQDKLAGMEQARRSLQTLRDDVTTVDAKRKEISAMIGKIRQTEKELKAELDELGAAGAPKTKEQEDLEVQAKADWEKFYAGEKLEHEVGRADGEAVVRSLLTRFDEESPEYIMAKQLLDTMHANMYPTSLVFRNSAPGKQQSYFYRGDGDASVISLRLQKLWGENATLDQILKGMTDEDARIVLHEFSHYRLQHVIGGVANGSIGKASVKKAVAELELLRRDVEEDLKGKLDGLPGTKYAITNVHEFVAQIFNSKEFRDELHKLRRVTRGEKLPIWSKILNSLLEALGFDKNKETAFTQAYSAMETLLDTHGLAITRGESVQYGPSKKVGAGETVVEDPAAFSKDLSKKLGVKVVLEGGPRNQLSLALLQVPDHAQSHGFGTKALEKVREYADATGRNVTLTATAKTPDLQARLNAFYERNGFTSFGKDPLTGKPYYGYKAQPTPDTSARRAAIEQQLAELSATKQTLIASHKAALTDTRAAKEARSEVRDLTNVKAVDAVQLPLAAARAKLADAEANPEAVFQRMVQTLTTQADTKGRDLTRKWMRQAMTNSAHRELGQEVHFADMARSILDENWHNEYVTQSMADDFRKKLLDRITDKTRTELDLTASTEVDGKVVRLLDLLSTDGLGMVKSMAHQHAGNSALARKQLQDPVKQQAALEAMLADGASEKAMDEMKFIFDLYSGRVDPGTHPELWAALRNGTYFATMGKLGESMLADLPAAITLMGIGALPRVFGGVAKSILTGDAFVHNKGLTEFGKQLMLDAPGTMGMDYRLHTDHTEGGAGMGAASTKSFLARMASKGAQITSAISLANTVSSVMHRIVTPYIAEELLAAVKASSKIPDSRLAELGLSPDELTRIRKYMDAHDAGRKPGQKVNWDKWDGEEGQYAADVLIGAIHRAVYQTLQKAMVGETPSWTSRTQLGQAAVQLHSYGLIAAEKQLVRNLAHGDSNTGIAMAMTLVWASMLYVGRVHANALQKEKTKRDEYIKQSLSGGRMVNGVFMLWNSSGLLPEAIAVGQVFWGNKEDVGGKIEATPRSGSAIAAAGFVSNVGEAISATGNWVRGVEDTQKMLKEVADVAPGGNSRLVQGILSTTR